MLPNLKGLVFFIAKYFVAIYFAKVIKASSARLFGIDGFVKVHGLHGFSLIKKLVVYTVSSLFQSLIVSLVLV